MQEVIDERSDAIEEIYKGLVEVNKMFKDLSEIVNDNEVCVWIYMCMCMSSILPSIYQHLT